jgi:hypothetical protein
MESSTTKAHQTAVKQYQHPTQSDRACRSHSPNTLSSTCFFALDLSKLQRMCYVELWKPISSPNQDCQTHTILWYARTQQHTCTSNVIPSYHSSIITDAAKLDCQTAPRRGVRTQLMAQDVQTCTCLCCAYAFEANERSSTWFVGVLALSWCYFAQLTGYGHQLSCQKGH